MIYWFVTEYHRNIDKLKQKQIINFFCVASFLIQLIINKARVKQRVRATIRAVGKAHFVK